jgi:hypothetical protein
MIMHSPMLQGSVQNSWKLKMSQFFLDIHQTIKHVWAALERWLRQRVPVPTNIQQLCTDVEKQRVNIPQATLQLSSNNGFNRFPPQMYTQYPIMTKQKQVFRKLKYHIYISIQNLYSSTLLKHISQRLQPWVLFMTLQAWDTCIWGVSPILLYISSQALSGWMGSVAAQLFSGLSRDVRSCSSAGSGWATQIHSETCPEASPALFWRCA